MLKLKIDHIFINTNTNINSQIIYKNLAKKNKITRVSNHLGRFVYTDHCTVHHASTTNQNTPNVGSRSLSMIIFYSRFTCFFATACGGISYKLSVLFGADEGKRLWLWRCLCVEGFNMISDSRYLNRILE
eukprot:434895_1